MNRKVKVYLLFSSTIFQAIAIPGQQSESPSSIPTDTLVNELQEVIVTANQSSTRLVGNTLVSTIPGTPLQNLGTALDVLAQLPMITVSGNSVSVIGKGVPEIYIDGRPLSDDEELRRLLSTNVKRVELIMAPGAMYASDTNAVIKITTKRNFIRGLSLTESVDVRKSRKLSANNMSDLNYHIGNWDLFTSGTIARNNSEIKGTTTNTLFYDGEKTVVGSSQRKNYPSTVGSIKAGFNHSSGEQSFGAYYRYHPEHGHFSNIGDEWLDNNPRIARDIYTDIRSFSHLVSTYYDDKFKEKYHFHFDGDYRYSHSTNEVNTVYPAGNNMNVNSADTRRSSLWAAKAYLSFPFADGNFTFGTQDSYTHTTLDYRMLNQDVSEYIPSSYTDARQISAAFFTTYERIFGKFSLSAGLRYEYIDYMFKKNRIKDHDISRRDNLITPDLSLGYYFNDESQISLSYKMATVKPPYSQLTGSLSYVGRHEIEGGNPALKDERMHDISLFGMWKGLMLQADYTRSIDTYTFVKRVYPASTLQLLMQPINVNVSAVDLYLMWSRPVKVWTPNVTIGMHSQRLSIDGTKYNRPIFSYYFDNVINLPRGFFVTLNVNGSTRGDMHTNCFGPTWFTLDTSVSKYLFNKSLHLQLSATDVFNTRNNDWTMNTYGIYVDKRQSYDRRGISLSLTYRFQPRKSKYKGQTASDEETKRL